MSDRRLIAAFRMVAVAGFTLSLGGLAVTIAMRGIGSWMLDSGSGVVFVAPFATFFAVFVWLAIPQQPRNRVVWSMASSTFFGGIYLTALAAAATLVADPDLLLEVGINRMVPADLPLSAAWILVLAAAAISLAIYSWMTFGLLLFPDGQLPSPRWRWVARFVAVSMLAFTIGFAWTLRPSSTRMPDDETLLTAIVFPAITLAIILSLAALVTRFRGSRGATRQQFKWVVWGAAVFVPLLVIVSTVDGTDYESPFLWALLLAAEAVFLASYGIAVAKYRLYDIDVVISKTVTYGVLAILITGVYVAIVVGVGALVGGGDEPNLALAIGATALVALLFEPVRSRLQHWANRLVYGERATPYAVLSELTARMSEAESDDQALDRLAQLIASGTGAAEAVVWLRVGNHLRPEATTSQDAPRPVRAVGGELPDLPGDAAAPIEHGGDLLGALSIQKDTADQVTPSDQSLLEDVAAGAGLLLRNIRLNAELADRAAELRESRRRLVAAQDLERRTLERDLHDGAQQQVVALKVKLGLARTLAEREGIEQVAGAVADLADDAQRAVDGMRAAARGIYPPLLEAEGVPAALVAAGRDVSIPVTVEAERFGRYPPEIEATIYFSVQASIGTAGTGQAATVSLDDDGEAVTFSVQRGHSGGRAAPDLTAVADRVDALGGTFSVNSTPAGGAVITGRVPATSLEPL